MSPERPALLSGGDGGGSHTAVAIADGDLRILGRAEGPGAAMRPEGGTRSAAVIAELVREAGGRAGVTLPADRLVVGAAGAGREPEREQLVAALLACGLAGEVRALGDAEAALMAAFKDGPGILVSAGTGSIAKRAVDAAARELVGLAGSLERRFPGREPVPVALAGGLFHRGSALLTAFQRLLNADMPRARLASEPVDPVLGALRLAREIPS